VPVRQNLVKNPSFEVGVSDWIPTNATVTRVSGTTPAEVQSGGYLGHVVNGGGGAGIHTELIPVTANTDYTFSFYTKALPGVRYLAGIQWFAAGGGYVSEAHPSVSTADGLWNRASVTARVPSGVTQAFVEIRVISTGAWIDVDAVLFEAYPNLYTYFDGSVPGASWAGTPHASISEMTQPIIIVYSEDAYAYVRMTTAYEGYDHAQIWRFDGDKPPVRIRNVMKSDGTIFPPVEDHEAPLDQQICYAVTAWNDPDPEPLPPVAPLVCTTIDAADEDVWFKNIGFPTLNQKVPCTLRIDERQYAANIGVFRPIGARYPVAISDVRTSWTGDVEWVTYTFDQFQDWEALFAPGNVLLLQTAAAYGRINEYVMVEGVSVGPVDRTATNQPARTWAASVITVASPTGYQTLTSDYDYDELRDEHLTYDLSRQSYHDYYNLMIDRERS
jgi:hypothetical protein